jgi:MFS family permease
MIEKINKGKTNPKYPELAAVFFAYFTSFFVIYSLNIAMPRIAAELNGIPLFSWAISIPALASAIVTLIFGKLSDLYGRRIIMLVSTGFILLGGILCAISQTFTMLIMALSILGLGQGSLPPLCFSILGDIYASAERSKWAGLLSFSSGIAAIIVPTLSGWLVDNLSWRYIFWMDIPLALILWIIILFGLPVLARRQEHRIDFLGSVYLAIASSTMILGVSWAGNTYSWASVQIMSLLGSSVIFWMLFLRAEAKAPEPMLDLQVVTNRTFLTASLSALMSFFGLTAITVYYPLFLQGIQDVNATMSGKILTPFNVLMSFMGIPAGLLIAKTRHYKLMFIVGYAILTIAMVGMVVFTAETAFGWGFFVTTLAGIGLGAIPTINAMVVQYSVPQRLLGVATGGLYFFVIMGRSIAPAILGSAMNMVYSRDLAVLLPVHLKTSIDTATLTSISNPRVLLSAQAMAELQDIFRKTGDQAPALFEQIVQAIRSSLESGLHTVFLIGAVTMLVSFLLILTIPEISLDGGAED